MFQHQNENSFEQGNYEILKTPNKYSIFFKSVFCFFFNLKFFLTSLLQKISKRSLNSPVSGIEKKKFLDSDLSFNFGPNCSSTDPITDEESGNNDKSAKEMEHQQDMNPKEKRKIQFDTYRKENSIELFNESCTKM